MPKPKIVVFTPYFKARTEERQAELDECVRRNASCEHVDEVVLLVDDGHPSPVRERKVTHLPIPARPTYQDWLRLSLSRERPMVSLLANTDIYFDDSVVELQRFLVGKEKFLALTRYEKEGDRYFQHPNPHWSQDVWGFYTGNPISPPLFKALDIPLGVPRCDNKIAYLFAVHGWEVFNPLGRVKTVHLHETQQRSYDKKADLTVMGGVAYVHVSDDERTPSQIELDIWLKGVSRVSKVALNKSLDNWAKAAAKAQSDSNAEPARQPVPRAPDRSQAAELGLGYASPELLNPALKHGKPLFDFLARFKVLDHEGQILCVDTLSPDRAMALSPDAKERMAKGEFTPADAIASAFLSGAMSTFPLEARERPLNANDVHFWQYPCSTELQALDTVRQQTPLTLRRIDRKAPERVYLGLPWATYIDKKKTPPEVLRYCAPRIQGLKQLAAHLGLQLEVHTVCQQIHWYRFAGLFADLGFTDLHLSHAVEDVVASGSHPYRIHSWPLIAVNIEVPGRQAGLVIGKPVRQRKYLATFIGAYMKHYRSDVRVQIFEAAKAAALPDVVVDLGGEWHFNKIVYAEQVAGKAIAAQDREKEENATRNYNEVISDSIFSLCPEGAGPNTLRLWESLAVGAIPVVFADEWIPPEVPNTEGLRFTDAALIVKASEIPGLFQRLAAMPDDERERRSQRAMQLYALYKTMNCLQSTGLAA